MVGLIETAAPDDLLSAIEQYKATVVFTAPTAYRALLAKLAGRDISSLRKCVSAGEALPKATFDASQGTGNSKAVLAKNDVDSNSNLAV